MEKERIVCKQCGNFKDVGTAHNCFESIRLQQQNMLKVLQQQGQNISSMFQKQTELDDRIKRLESQVKDMQLSENNQEPVDINKSL